MVGGAGTLFVSVIGDSFFGGHRVGSNVHGSLVRASGTVSGINPFLEGTRLTLFRPEPKL